MMQYLPADFDMEKFEFRQGANAERMLRKRKSRKLGFDFGKDFKMVGNSSKPSRQTKKSRESLPISILRNPEGEKKRYHVRSRYFNPFFRPFFGFFLFFVVIFKSIVSIVSKLLDHKNNSCFFKEIIGKAYCLFYSNSNKKLTTKFDLLLRKLSTYGIGIKETAS